MDVLHNPIVLALIFILIVALVAGFIAWLVNTLAPVDSPYKRVALGTIAAIAIVIILLTIYSLFVGHTGMK